MNMKIRITYIVLLLLVLLTGCAKYITPDSGSEATSYIFFSQSLDTKAPLVESGNAMGSFAVVGYKYDKAKEWANTTAADRETVFYDDQADQALPVNPETIKISNGICSYEPLQGWSNTKKYSFFAYYPLNNGKVVLSNTDNGGTPTITYTMDISSAANFKASMVDVMTAPCHKDLYAYTSIGPEPKTDDINFDFDHHLSCVGVKVKKTSSCDIVLNSITLKVSGIKNNILTIPLDGTASTADGPNNPFSADLALTLGSTEKTVSTAYTELSDKLIFVPQSENISIQAIVNYTRKLSGYVDVTLEVPLTTVQTSLTEKNKHLIQLNFTDSNVTVSSVTNSGWIDIEDVHNTFN